ncbi:MAG: hypothetical protein BM556_05525 [Bacteriovorax sp. MedPE-SWde]|mgnify:CR=1 FL=1|nr:MAG: hypothetical protein BM556_05525 [Bacteriovorax sp. MedPE-SWde]
MQIVVVDDDNNIRMSLTTVLSEAYDVCDFPNAEDALAYLEKNTADLVITDQKMPGMTGVELIEKVKAISPKTSFFLMTAYASIQQAIEALQKGADDYIMKPFDLDEMELRVNRIKQLRLYGSISTLSEESKKGLENIIGESSNIQEAKAFVEKVADAPSSVLVLGPTGSGKEVLGRSIHEVSNRSTMPFVAINCATLNDQLIESELFGHEKGSFTGATETKQGKFELANGGTIFLDEIGELSLDLQAKLLRVLQEREFYRIGGNKLIKCDVRVLAATHQNLEEMVSKGTFREDLLYRLNVLVFNLQALKDRVEDIKPIAEFLWAKLLPELNRKSTLTIEALKHLEAYSWPGNIRELKNVLERMIVLGPQEGPITLDSLPRDIAPKATGASNTSISTEDITDLESYMQEMEFSIIKSVYEREDSNQVKTAESLGLKRGTLQYKLKKMKELGLIE